MRIGQVSVVDWRDGPAFDLFDIAAVADPFRPERRQTFGDFDALIGVTPRTAGIVNADRLVLL